MEDRRKKQKLVRSYRNWSKAGEEAEKRRRKTRELRGFTRKHHFPRVGLGDAKRTRKIIVACWGRAPLLRCVSQIADSITRSDNTMISSRGPGWAPGQQTNADGRIIQINCDVLDLTFLPRVETRIAMSRVGGASAAIVAQHGITICRDDEKIGEIDGSLKKVEKVLEAASNLDRLDGTALENMKTIKSWCNKWKKLAKDYWQDLVIPDHKLQITAGPGAEPELDEKVNRLIRWAQDDLPGMITSWIEAHHLGVHGAPSDLATLVENDLRDRKIYPTQYQSYRKFYRKFVKQGGGSGVGLNARKQLRQRRPESMYETKPKPTKAQQSAAIVRKAKRDALAARLGAFGGSGVIARAAQRGRDARAAELARRRQHGVIRPRRQHGVIRPRASPVYDVPL